MSIFHCDSHGHEEDSDYVGCVALGDGRLVCDERAAEVEAECEQEREQEREAFRAMSLSAQREAIGGEFGGDGPDD